MKNILVILSILFYSGIINAQKESDSLKTNSSNAVDSVFACTIFEIMPEFPGGNDALLKFISSNIKYPLASAEQGIQGIVYLSFIIEKDGSISEVKNLRGVNTEIDTEAIRVVKLMPKWKPGMQNGVPVRVMFRLPIRFRLD